MSENDHWWNLLISGESDPNEEELEENDGIKKEGSACVKQEKDAFNAGSADKKDGQNNTLKVEKDLKEAQRAKELKINESEMVRDLKTQLKWDFYKPKIPRNFL